MAPRIEDLIFGLMNNQMQSKRNQAGTRTRKNQVGGPVPGLPGARFSPDLPTAMQKAAKSVQTWHTDRGNHPAIGWSRGMAGIDGGGAVDALSKEVFSRLSSKGIYRDDSGTWKIRGTEDAGQKALGQGKASGPAADMLSVQRREVVPATITGTTGSIKAPAQDTSGLSGLGQRIAGDVQSRIGSRATSGPASNMPTAQSIQQVVEGRLRQSGVGQSGTGQPQSPSAAPGTPGSQPVTPVGRMSIPSIGSVATGNVPPSGLGQTASGVVPGTRSGNTITQPTPNAASRNAALQPQPTQGGLSAVGATTNPQPGGLLGQTPTMGGQSPMMQNNQSVNGAGPGQAMGGGTLGSYGNPTIDQWDQAFIAAGQKYGVDPTLLKAMMEIESGGNGNLPLGQCRDDGYGDGGSCGPMQIKPAIWGSVGSVPEQIEQAAKILDDGVKSGQYATHRDALFGIYFPGNDPNGTTQGSYGARVDELQAQMGPYTPSAAGTPSGRVVPPTTPGQSPTILPAGNQSSVGSQAPVGSPAIPGSNVMLPGATPGQAPGGGLFGGNSTAPINEAGVPVTPTGESPASPTSGVGQRIPVATGTMNVNKANDGMGIAASVDTDETWMQIEHGQGALVSTEYKQPVTWSCTACGQGCLYDYQCPGGTGGYAPGSADASTHAGMDIVAPGGYGAPVYTSIGGTVLCSGGQGQGNYVGCTFATDPSVKQNAGDAGQISVNVGNDINGNMLVMEYWHMAGSGVQPGQQLSPGDQIGTQGGMGGMIHTHQEAHGWCQALGGYVPLDPTLVANGYYSNHDPCEGYV